MSNFAADFDLALARHAPGLPCRPRTPEDADFLIACTIACSPMAGMLPDAMVAQQAAFQRAAHDAAHPDATHRIVVRDGAPVGHILIAWNPAGTHLVDIALLPAHQRSGAGECLLRAWIEVADAHGLAATLEVRADNPARQLYARLGFVDTDPDPWAPVIDMNRSAVQR